MIKRKMKTGMFALNDCNPIHLKHFLPKDAHVSCVREERKNNNRRMTWVVSLDSRTEINQTVIEVTKKTTECYFRVI